MVADALSRLSREDQQRIAQSASALAEAFALTELPKDAFPLRYSTLRDYQQHDKPLLAQLATNSNFKLITYHGGGKTYDLICHNDKIVVPKALRQRVLEFYHYSLSHPGETRTEQTIRQQFTWPKLRDCLLYTSPSPRDA